MVQQVGQAPGRPLPVGVGEGARIWGTGAGHAGIRVTEAFDPCTAERLGRALQLGVPQLRQLSLGEYRRGRQSGASGGGHDEHDAVALGGRAGQGASGQQDLVVRVGVERDQGVRHRATVPRLRSSRDGAGRG
jgi:hypothetical protein